MQRLYPIFQHEINKQYSPSLRMKLCPRVPTSSYVYYKQQSLSQLINLKKFDFKDQSGIRRNTKRSFQIKMNTFQEHL